MVQSHNYICTNLILFERYNIFNKNVSSKCEIKLSNCFGLNLLHADDTTLMAESEEELKTLLMKVKVESEKVGLSQQVQHSENKDHSIWSHHFMGNRWGNSGNSG